MRKTIIDIDDLNSKEIRNYKIKATKNTLKEKGFVFVLIALVFAIFDIFIIDFFSWQSFVMILTSTTLYGLGYFIVMSKPLKNRYIKMLNNKAKAEIEFLANKIETYGYVKDIPELSIQIEKLRASKAKFIQMLNHKLVKTELYYLQSAGFIDSAYREILHQLDNWVIEHQTETVTTEQLKQKLFSGNELITNIDEATKQLSLVSNTSNQALERDAEKLIIDLKKIAKELSE